MLGELIDYTDPFLISSTLKGKRAKSTSGSLNSERKEPDEILFNILSGMLTIVPNHYRLNRKIRNKHLCCT